MLTPRVGVAASPSGSFAHPRTVAALTAASTPTAEVPGNSTLTAVTFVDAQHGWAVGRTAGARAYGALMATTDGGTNWALQPIPSDVQDLSRLSFVDSQHGWAVGRDRANSPEVIGTADAGALWTRMPLPLGFDAIAGALVDVHFVDQAHGWAIGERDGGVAALLLSTSDGGANWRDQSAAVPSADRPAAIDFTDLTHGWLALNDSSGQSVGLLLATSDGGSSWTRQTNLQFPGSATAMRFVDSADGLIVSNGMYDSSAPGASFVTHDAGASWQRGSLPANQAYGLAVTDPWHAWVTTSGAGTPVVASTTDGVNWSSTAFPSSLGVMNAIAVTNGRLVVVGSSPCNRASIAISTDGGSSWSEQLSTAPYPSSAEIVLNDPLTLLINDSCNGWALGRIANGAVSYLPLPPGTQRVLSASFVNSTTGWLLASNGSGFALWSTTDAGSTWQSHALPDQLSQKVIFYDSSHGITVNYGTTSVTTDGGSSWTTVQFEVHSIQYIDATHLWGLGMTPHDGIRPASSSDGGLTWNFTQPLPTPNTAEDLDFSFADTNRGWVVGVESNSDGFVVSTGDGGVTWSKQSTPFPTFVERVSFAPGTSTGWRALVVPPSTGQGSANQDLQRTTDGVHWSPVFVPNHPDVIDWIRAVDQQHVVLVTHGPSGVIVDQTNDGGSTWLQVFPNGGGGAPDATPAAPPGPFEPISPTRICDTRPVSATEPANQCSGRRLGTSANGGLETLDLGTAGLAGLPPDPAAYSAVILHVTATRPDQGGYVTAFSSGVAEPYVSNLNTVGGKTVGNLVQVATGSDGRLELNNAWGGTDLVVDLEGYVSSSSVGSAGTYTGVSPFRVCDTRPATGTQCSGMTMGSNSTIDVQVTGLAGSGVPGTGVSAVVLNTTITGPEQAGFLTVYPTGSAQPLASSLNFGQGEVVANRVAVPVGPCPGGSGGCVTVFNYSGRADVVLDVGGYYGDGSSTAGGRFTAATPLRVCDTRGISASNLTVCAGQSFSGGSVLRLQLGGQDGIPLNASAVVMNITVTGSSTAGYLTAYPGTDPQPLASDVNFTATQTVPNLTVTALGGDGTVSLYSPCGACDVVVDVVGYYS